MQEISGQYRGGRHAIAGGVVSDDMRKYMLCRVELLRLSLLSLGVARGAGL